MISIFQAWGHLQSRWDCQEALLKEVEKLLEVPPLFFLLLSPDMGPAGEDLYHSECTGFMALKFWKLGVHFVCRHISGRQGWSKDNLSSFLSNNTSPFRNKSCWGLKLVTVVVSPQWNLFLCHKHLSKAFTIFPLSSWAFHGLQTSRFFIFSRILLT